MANYNKIKLPNGEIRYFEDSTARQMALEPDWENVQNKPDTLSGYGISEVPASMLDGVIDMSNMPQGALERLIVVANMSAMFALTKEIAQNGDVVKVEDTNEMYFIVDDNHLSSILGYKVFTAGTASSVQWDGVLRKPNTIAGYGITDAYTKVEMINMLADKVDKVTGKQLSTEDYTTAEKQKLAGIEPGAEENVNPDWDATSGDAEILNKPDTLDGYGVKDIPSIFGTCSSAANAQVKEVTVSDPDWQLRVGAIAGVKFTNTNTYNATASAPCQLNVNNTGAKNIYYGSQSTPTGTITNAFGYSGRITYYMYDGTYWVWLGRSTEQDNYVPASLCITTGDTAAKTANHTNYALLAKSYTLVTMAYSNTAQSALTLDINGRGAKPIYINGTASSASNYTLPAGTYLVYYDGTNYYFRTDGIFTGVLPVASETNNGIVTTQTQSFNGQKTFLTNPRVSSNGNMPGFYIATSKDGANKNIALIYCVPKTIEVNGETKAVGERLILREISYNSETGEMLNYYEQYRLPAVPADKSGNTTYDILTSKTPVTVGQGGTGSATATGAANNLSFLPQSSIAPIEGTSASKAYSVGDLIIRNSALYRVMRSVASGAAWGEGNTIATTLAKEIASMRKGYTLYAFHIDGSKSNPSEMVTYLEDATDMIPAQMDYTNGVFDYGSWEDAFFMPRPCMVLQTGEVDYYLDPDDYTKKIDGTASDIADTSYVGNAMMQWGREGRRIYYKVVPDANDITSATVYICDKKLDSDFHDWSFINNQGVEVDHFYTPIYNGSSVNDGSADVMRSMSGLAVSGSLTVTEEVARCVANNKGSDTLWYTEVMADRILINFLLMLMCKSTDTQTFFGRGLSSGSQSAFEAYRTGALNDKGLFYGYEDGSHGVKVFGMENLWGTHWRRTAGYIKNGIDQRIKLTYGQQDGSTVDGYNTDGSNYISMGIEPVGGSSGINTMNYNKYGMFAKESSGTSSTYYCDGRWTDNSKIAYAVLGGTASNGGLCGALACNLSFLSTVSSWSIGTALSYKPAH